MKRKTGPYNSFRYWRDYLYGAARDEEIERDIYRNTKMWRWYIIMAINNYLTFTEEEMARYVIRDKFLLRSLMRKHGSSQLRSDYEPPLSVIKAGLLVHVL